MNEPDFSDPWFRKRFRQDMSSRNFAAYNESLEDSFVRLSDWLYVSKVVLSSSGKMAYDQEGRSNNLTNLYWPDREQFVDWARVARPDVIKKRGAGPQRQGRVTTPATKKPTIPKTTGWDDFDWSR